FCLPRFWPAPRVGTSTNTTNLALRICGNLLHCRKNLSLYPEGHPRVLEMVEAIRADLALHFQETGRPFSIETSTTLEESARGGRKKEETDDVTVGRLLKVHLIASVTLLPEATSDELIPFCFLLEEDVAKASKEGLWDKIDPDAWDHIRL